MIRRDHMLGKFAGLVFALSLVGAAIGGWFLLGQEGSGGNAIGPAEAVGDPSGEFRCERVGYVCTWAQATPEAIETSSTVASEVQSIVNAGPDPSQGIKQAVGYLMERDDVAEIIADEAGWTSVMWRIEGAPPSVAFTDLAGPLGESEPYDGPNYGQVDEETAWSIPTIEPIGYKPAGGPLEQQKALVIDPYADKATGCDGLEDKDCFKTKKDRVEGAAIAAIMGADDQIDVDYKVGLWFNPHDVPDLSGYDLVHVATHGSSACGSDIDWFRNGNFDSNKCYTVSAISKRDPGRSGAEVLDGEAGGPAGIWMSGEFWVVTGEFWANHLSSEAITYMSHCTSGDGELARSRNFGSFVGWSGYAKLSKASKSATRFWQLMVTEGVEFNVAIGQLANEKLTETDLVAVGGSLSIDDFEINIDWVEASLVVGGKNLRARDVITAFYPTDEISDGSVISIEGEIGDGENDTIAGLVFEVEGVKTGADAASIITVHLDGVELPQTVKVSEGEIIDQGEGWAKWRVVVEHFELGFDLTMDEANKADHHTWESRVADGSDGYSAHLAESVILGGEIRVTGPLAIFEELDQAIRPEGHVEGNELAVTFPSNGGEANGELHLSMISNTLGSEIGQWNITLLGSHDGTGGLGGTFEADVFGGVAGIVSGEEVAGEWDGTFDSATGTLTGVIGEGSDQISFTLGTG